MYIDRFISQMYNKKSKKVFGNLIAQMAFRNSSLQPFFKTQFKKVLEVT